jgi:hypothetical protein
MGPQLDACASVDVDRRNLPKTGMLKRTARLVQADVLLAAHRPGRESSGVGGDPLGMPGTPKRLPLDQARTFRGTLMHLATHAFTVIGWSWRG